ncbi:MAG: tripartite tricarboxylate transporter substrate binding protein [Alcaligenaceae bacterium]|nr:MAG: tripartite tricarboxylate transporter substrate binding protein [Alcaligenaceae bacterium]
MKIFAALAVAAVSIHMAPVFAAYPERPITLVIGFTAGGPTDAVGRFLARNLEKELGQTVVVENRAGANGVLAVSAVKRANPDGYTLMLGSSGTLSVEPAYKKKVDYDVLKDFAPVGLVATYPYLLVVPASSPFKSVEEMIAGARAKPGSLTFASAGSGAVNHLGGEWFASATQTKWTHVPYKGDSAAVGDLAAGRVDMALLAVIAAQPQIDGGKLRALAIASSEKSPLAPDLPTVAQAANIPGFAAAPWNGVLAPAGVDPAIVTRLNAAINKVMSTEEARRTLTTLGQFPFTGSPDDMGRQIREQSMRWKEVISQANIERAD